MPVEQKNSYSAKILGSVQPSASAWVSQAAKKLIAEGRDVIDLGLGEPDFDTPTHIIEAAYNAAKRGETRYPPTDGTPSLKQAIVEKFFRDNELTFDPSEIIVSNGAKQVIFDALMATLNPGDEVLLCAPYFGQYSDMVTILGGQPVEIPCTSERHFLLDAKALEAAITENTRWIILNSPSNPSGATYTEHDYSALEKVLVNHDNVLILSDEIYEHIVFDNFEFVSFATACPNLRSRTLTVNGVSKAYAMTGWRIGYGAGPEKLIKAMTKVQSQISSGACSVAQAAAVAALTGSQQSVADFKAAFERRRDLVVDKVKGISGITLDAPHGAFYAFIGCDELIGATTETGDKLSDDAAVTGYLLEDAGVAAVPGSAYGLSPFFRISTATDDKTLSIALDRIARSIDKLTFK